MVIIVHKVHIHRPHVHLVRIQNHKEQLKLVNAFSVHRVSIVQVVQATHMLTFLAQVIIVKLATTVLQDLKHQIQLLVQKVMLVHKEQFQ